MKSQDDKSTVSFIIPCLNEENCISGCLDSVLAQDYPKEKIDVLLVDGMSTDGTREIIKKYTEKYPFIKLLNNPKGRTSEAFNIGIKSAQGDYLIILGCHSRLDKDFTSKSVEGLNKYHVDCVGGVIITFPTGKTLVAQSIALALSHPFGVGNAYFRIGSKKPRYVETVPFGCYKKEVFRRIGFFDEDVIVGQDCEFNFRLIKNGGRLLLVPEIISYYYARDTLSKLWRQYFRYGYFKPLIAHKVKAVLTWRQLMPAILVGSLILSAALSMVLKPFLGVFLMIALLYITADLFFSFSIAANKRLKYLFALPLVFPTIHFSYGIAYLKGILDFIVLKKHKGKPRIVRAEFD